VVLAQFLETMKGVGLDPAGLLELCKIQEAPSAGEVRLPAVNKSVNVQQSG
jgi:hypothetical protein